MKTEFKTEDGEISVKYEDSPEMHKAVFDRVIDFFKKHESFNGECIMQSDNPTIDSRQFTSDVAYDIIKFEVEYIEDSETKPAKPDPTGPSGRTF